MDFSNLLDIDFSNLLNSLNALIPDQIAGVDSLYIILALVLVLLLVYVYIKRAKKEPKRDLEELVPEAMNEAETIVPEEDEVIASEAISEEEGFMPPLEEAQELHVNEEPEDEPAPEEQSESEDVLEETPAEEEAEQEEEAEEPVEPAREASGVVRKKRESTRDGRKIVKADFADFSGRRLLIAEDNLINQKVINGVLNESGIDVVMADDGQIALDILEKDSDFEIILMDAHMPRVDGFEATRAIRAKPEYDHIMVAALSGDTAADDIRHMREAGMEEHLEKPLKMDALYDVMSMYYTMDEAEEELPAVEEEIKELEIEIDINDLASLDYDLGLEICGNDENMYRMLLKEFFEGYKDSPKKLRDALVSKDIDQVQAMLIDVKGTASNLGAKQFIHIADRFLEAVAANDKEAYSALFKDYQKYLLILLKSIQNAFKV